MPTHKVSIYCIHQISTDIFHLLYILKDTCIYHETQNLSSLNVMKINQLIVCRWWENGLIESSMVSYYCMTKYYSLTGEIDNHGGIVYIIISYIKLIMATLVRLPIDHNVTYKHIHTCYSVVSSFCKHNRYLPWYAGILRLRKRCLRLFLIIIYNLRIIEKRFMIQFITLTIITRNT